MNVNPSYQQQMDQLRMRYLKQVAERLMELERIRDNCHKQFKLDPAENLSLQTLAHKLAGSGSIFGFTAITETGISLEKTLREQAEIPTETFLPLLDKLIAACKEALS